MKVPAADHARESLQDQPRWERRKLVAAQLDSRPHTLAHEMELRKETYVVLLPMQNLKRDVLREQGVL